MPSETPNETASPARSAAGLGNAAMVLGITTTVGAVLLWFVVEGMTREARGRAIESVDDEGAALFGAVGCVAALFTCTGLIGLLLGGLALSRSARHNVPAVVGTVLCALWLVVGAIVLIARA